MTSPRRERGSRGADVGVGVLIGAGVAMGAMAVWDYFMSSEEEPQRESVRAMHEEVPADSQTLQIHVRGGSAQLLDSEGRVMLTIRNGEKGTLRTMQQIRRVAAWRTTEGNVTLMNLQRDGTWAKWSSMASAGTATLKTPVMPIGRNFVDVLSHPPDNYTPSPASEGACIVCMENKPDTTLYPCSHFSMCLRCTAQLPDARCPSCRQPITMIAYNFRQSTEE
eukprot:TRINITY_DN20396_c0_g1_i1.p1 TRINITY_DN20396_c0_g1~~TRINITY_DN20396_c0_g1_i1.p1  ORF type:complete len:234 (+),score=44.84 TRINITY_DN20396_c0_g1_i1:39-704(+)